jgi:hypothetical protein
MRFVACSVAPLQDMSAGRDARAWAEAERFTKPCRACLFAALQDPRERREWAAPAPWPAAGPAPAAPGTPISQASGGDAVMMCNAVPWAGCLA